MGILLFHGSPEVIGTLGIAFVSIVLEALPFVLLGAVLGGVIEVFVSREKLVRLFPADAWWAVLPAGLLGIVFPVCECAVVPVIRRLLRKGVPLSAAVTYLLAGPIVNPLVAASTAVAYKFDWIMVVSRLLFGFAIAAVVGLVIGALFQKRTALVDSSESPDASSHESNTCSHLHPTLLQRLHTALDCTLNDFIDVGRFLVLGAFIAAFIQTFVSRSALLFVADSPVLSIGVMMLLAVMLNLCSEADAFVAASFRNVFPPYAQLAFMLLGPMFDIKLLFMYLGVFRKRMIVSLVLLVLVSVFVTTLVLSLGGGGTK